MSTASRDKRADVMRRIRALIAKADDHSVTPEESHAFRAKADELMTKFAVEEFELMAAGRVTTAVETRDIDVSWYFKTYDDQDVRNGIWSLFHTTYKHCRCIPVPGKVDYTTKTWKAVGFPGDLDWADLLFTSLMLQLANAVDPTPTRELGYYGSLKLCREAGLSWPETYARMAASNVELPPDVLTYDTAEGRRDKMIRDYRAWCKRTGTPQNYNHHKTYRRSFTTGFYWEVVDRLAQLRGQQDAHKTEGGSEYAIVLRDVYKTVEEYMYEQWPNLRPKPAPERGADTVKKGRRVRMRRDTRAIDYSAYAAGKQAGREANISGAPGQRVGKGSPGQLEG